MDFSDCRCFALWGDNRVGWVHNEGENGVGGILSMWYKEAFEYKSHIKGKGFIVVTGIHVCTAQEVGSDDVASSYSIGVLTRRQVGRREGSRGARVSASY